MKRKDQRQMPVKDSFSEESEQSESHKLNRWLIPVLLLVTIIMIGIFLRREPAESPPPTDEVLLRAIGPDSAPVTITEFADFGCITCKAWHQFGIREEILAEYGKQVRFVWRDFPVTTAASPKAAEAGFCAHDQGQFWAYHDILYANAPALGANDLKIYAETIGLDTTQFNQCLDSGRHEESVERELAVASEQGFRSVPSFLVNGRKLIGPPSFEQLAAIIDEILAAQ